MSSALAVLEPEERVFEEESRNPVVVLPTDRGFVAQRCEGLYVVEQVQVFLNDETWEVDGQFALSMYFWTIEDKDFAIPLYALGRLNRELAPLLLEKWEPQRPVSKPGGDVDGQKGHIKIWKRKIFEKCLALQTKPQWQRLCATVPANIALAHRKTFAAVGPAYQGKLLCDREILEMPHLLDDIARYPACAAIVELLGEKDNPFEILRRTGWQALLSPDLVAYTSLRKTLGAYTGGVPLKLLWYLHIAPRKAWERGMVNS